MRLASHHSRPRGNKQASHLHRRLEATENQAVGEQSVSSGRHLSRTTSILGCQVWGLLREPLARRSTEGQTLGSLTPKSLSSCHHIWALGCESCAEHQIRSLAIANCNKMVRSAPGQASELMKKESNGRKQQKKERTETTPAETEER